jgi:hypothetical protein
MPLFIPPAVAAGAAVGVAFSVGVDYLIDRYIFQSDEYTIGEASAAAALGVFGGGFMKPAGSVLWKGRGAARSTYEVGKQSASRYGFASRRFVDDTVSVGMVLGNRALRGNIKPMAKATMFIAGGRGIDYMSDVMKSRARSQRSPNSTVDPGTPEKKKLPGGGQRPKSAKKKPRSSCPPGHYWSWKHNACMPSRF